MCSHLDISTPPWHQHTPLASAHPLDISTPLLSAHPLISAHPLVSTPPWHQHTPSISAHPLDINTPSCSLDSCRLPRRHVCIAISKLDISKDNISINEHRKVSAKTLNTKYLVAPYQAAHCDPEAVFQKCMLFDSPPQKTCKV